jgi:3-phenylpropionate/trans-cinnamate dioxygenase ferredoxin subunit
MSENFVNVASLSELAPGKMMRVEVGRLRILLANVNGRVCAADDTCSHEEASLSTGSLRGDLVKCPLHGSRFNVCTGEVLDDPASENLKTYPVRLDGENILVQV